MEKSQNKLMFNLSKIFFIIILFALAMPLFADREQRMRQTEEIMHAVRILKDIDTDQSKEWAVTALMKAVENDSVPYAMNALGLAYMAGAGVARDSTMAVGWLEKSGTIRLQRGVSQPWYDIQGWERRHETGLHKGIQSFPQGGGQGVYSVQV